MFIVLLWCLYVTVLFPQTESQIKQVKDYAKKKGMSITDIKKAAKERGYSDNQINDVIEKEKIKNDQKISQITTGKNDNLNENQNFESINDLNASASSNSSLQFDLQELDQSEIEIDEQNAKLSQKKEQRFQKNLKHFGYDIFRQDPSLFQATAVGAVDPDYLIGPGDEMIVMLWGETQFRQVLTVDREGFVFIPEIGQVFVNGLNHNKIVF